MSLLRCEWKHPKNWMLLSLINTYLTANQYNDETKKRSNFLLFFFLHSACGWNNTYLSSDTLITPSSPGIKTAAFTSSVLPSNLLSNSGLFTVLNRSFAFRGAGFISAAILYTTLHWISIFFSLGVQFLSRFFLVKYLSRLKRSEQWNKNNVRQHKNVSKNFYLFFSFFLLSLTSNARFACRIWWHNKKNLNWHSFVKCIECVSVYILPFSYSPCDYIHHDNLNPKRHIERDCQRFRISRWHFVITFEKRTEYVMCDATTGHVMFYWTRRMHLSQRNGIDMNDSEHIHILLSSEDNSINAHKVMIQFYSENTFFSGKSLHLS